MYNPKAVVSVMLRGGFKSYWSNTGTYEAIRPLLDMDFDGLKAAVLAMLSGDSAGVRVRSFQNDVVSLRSRDDVLTLLIHLGYLAYDEGTQTAFIPNEEIRSEFAEAVEENRWNEWMEFQRESAMTGGRRSINAGLKNIRLGSLCPSDKNGAGSRDPAPLFTFA